MQGGWSQARFDSSPTFNGHNGHTDRAGSRAQYLSKMSNEKKTVMEVVRIGVEKHATEAGIQFTDEMRDAVERAFYRKGKYAQRYLLKSPPSYSKDPWAFAVWCGVQPNVYKVPMGSCLFLRNDAKELMVALAKYQWPVQLDRDSHGLSNLGVW